MLSSFFVELKDSRLADLKPHRILTSLEGEHPGESIKDRMVYGELFHLIEKRVTKPGDAIAEITAGSTGLSLAHYSRAFQLKCVLFVPKSLNPLLVKKLQEMGAELHLLDPDGAYEKYDSFIQKTGIRKFDQFGNLSLRRHYHSFGQDIMSFAPITALIGAVGTGHSLFGVAESLDCSIPVLSAEPLVASSVSGIRNLRLESFGEKDPCDLSQLRRIELESQAFFPDSSVMTDHGKIEISDSFRVVLGGIRQHLQSCQTPQVIFALGAHNRRSAA